MERQLVLRLKGNLISRALGALNPELSAGFGWNRVERSCHLVLRLGASAVPSELAPAAPAWPRHPDEEGEQPLFPMIKPAQSHLSNTPFTDVIRLISLCRLIDVKIKPRWRRWSSVVPV